MSENTSATGGYLTPDGDGAPEPLEGKALNVFLQAVIVGVLGIDGSLVRPRWQPEPPNLPAADVSWVAMGITLTQSDWQPALVHDGDANEGQGETTLQRQQRITMLVSCYGPDAQSYADILRDGLQVSQNLAVLISNGFNLISTEDSISVPSLVMEKWQMRIDVPVVLTRCINRVYSIRNIESAAGTINAEQVTVDFEVQR